MIYVYNWKIQFLKPFVYFCTIILIVKKAKRKMRLRALEDQPILLFKFEQLGDKRMEYLIIYWKLRIESIKNRQFSTYLKNKGDNENFTNHGKIILTGHRLNLWERVIERRL